MINLKSRVIEGDVGRESFHPLAQSPDGCNNLGWAKLQSGARSFLPISHKDTGGEELIHLFSEAISRKLD